jgi:tetratricopeptide (TPR) repeat protein
VIQAERALAPELLAELDARAPAARREAVRTIRRYQLLGLVQLLADQSREAVIRDLGRALELAELAVAASDTLDPRIYISITTADMRSLARACLGNARRVGSDLFGAEEIFQDSLALLQEGNRTSPVRADVWSLVGSLRIDQGRYAEAQTVLGDALREFVEIELEPEQTKVRILLANAHAYAGDAEEAVALLREAIDRFTDEIDERLQLEAQHNLTYCLISAGQPLEALARFEKARPLYDEHFQAPALRLRRRWLEGTLYAALGDLDLARSAFEDVRAAAIEREQSYELAMVSLELALVHLRTGETQRVRDLAEEMTLIFRSHELHRHALGAMYIFRQAARKQTASAGLVREILRYLQRARNNPYARFEPSDRTE